MLWKRKKPQIEKRNTPFGEFIKESRDWEGSVEVRGEEITVLADDVNGEPNPILLNRLASVLDDLPKLEQTARRNVADVRVEYQLSLITNVEEPGEFTLGFTGGDEVWSETIFVDFANGEVISWCAVD